MILRKTASVMAIQMAASQSPAKIRRIDNTMTIAESINASDNISVSLVRVVIQAVVVFFAHRVNVSRDGIAAGRRVQLNFCGFAAVEVWMAF